MSIYKDAIAKHQRFLTIENVKSRSAMLRKYDRFLPVMQKIIKSYCHYTLCNEILLSVLLLIGLLTRIMSFPFFYLLMFPESDSTSWDQIELFHAGKKVMICGPVESKYHPPTRKCCSPKIRAQAAQAVPPGCSYKMDNIKGNLFNFEYWENTKPKQYDITKYDIALCKSKVVEKRVAHACL
ncbi:hypothetical protein PHYBLDRAFT_58880 [Phycomyces blakesleeanus NRRL 1555(-)]|uniref:Uncharacterized protein n=1 Tax=Phycomyces blakesleeanus (strain ATCC 8743b / DSM 1359 / FGSC 10004 / NBRC 33097 / NRRL 1555) TaxID=763407 RepID=A0A162Q402_PHYB8|nr:hypothetical protein PHYBLDRAFT_58880 [Phycomyces blakesleeanus NRRL 1555(-)]OAD79836.1 hypothetical protein PHYBLDRAFT_58880 [Phycomyces blakesleeanus NRRL 1555(-)]|eukprot:XP_018297876.1 hypothetical protein PHYBLDRAFT_58880 [Phycomyces blakesleeanus NRRL 1555(-)]